MNFVISVPGSGTVFVSVQSLERLPGTVSLRYLPELGRMWLERLQSVTKAGRGRRTVK